MTAKKAVPSKKPKISAVVRKHIAYIKSLSEELDEGNDEEEGDLEQVRQILNSFWDDPEDNEVKNFDQVIDAILDHPNEEIKHLAIDIAPLTYDQQLKILESGNEDLIRLLLNENTSITSDIQSKISKMEAFKDEDCFKEQKIQLDNQSKLFEIEKEDLSKNQTDYSSLIKDINEKKYSHQIEELWDNLDPSECTDEVVLAILSNKNCNLQTTNNIIEFITDDYSDWNITDRTHRKTFDFLISSPTIKKETRGMFQIMCARQGFISPLIKNQECLSPAISEHVGKLLVNEDIYKSMIPSYQDVVKSEEHKNWILTHGETDGTKTIFVKSIAPTEDIQPKSLTESNPFSSIVADTAIHAAKTAAAQLANKKLVEIAQNGIVKTNILPQFIIESKPFEIILSLAAPALLLTLVNSQKELIGSHIGQDQVSLLNELAKDALGVASSEALKPILESMIPVLKSFASAKNESVPELKEKN